MLRSTSGSLTRGVLRTAASRSRPARSPLVTQLKNASSAAGGGGSGGKFALVAGATVVTLAGGTLGYAGLDPDFRKIVEDSVPGAKDVFHAVLGEPEKPTVKGVVADAPPPSKTRPVAKPDAAAAASPPALASTTPPRRKTPSMEPPPMPPLEEPAPKKKAEEEPANEAERKPEIVEEKAKDGGSNNMKKKKKKKKAAAVLGQLVEDMKVATGMAALSAERSCEAIERHGRLVVSVLEQDVDGENERAWHEVMEAATAKSEAVRAAQDKIQAAREATEKVAKLVEEAGGSKDPQVEEATSEAEQSAKKLREIAEEIGAARKDSYLIQQYRDLVEEGRQSFRKELVGILSDQGDAKQEEEEVNAFVAHAYRKVCSLQQQLAKVKLLQTQIDHSAATDLQLRKQVATEQVVLDELEAQRRQLEVEYQHRIHAMREEMEGEVRGQLRRQAAAHSDHVQDALEVRESELVRKHERRLDEALAEERAAYHREIAKVSGQVEGLKASLKDRAKLQQAVREAQELWLACCALVRAVRASGPESGGLLPLKDEVEAIRKAAKGLKNNKEDELFVEAVLGGLPEQAIGRGVFTDQTIRDRFFKVEHVAKRTALVPEEGGSLMLYFLSYLQSLFALIPPTHAMPDPNVAIDVDSLSTFDVVWLARGCVERGDLEQAVKYMTLLKGEPKNVSGDWINEARLLLETKLVCDVLLSHAAAFGLEALPQKPPTV